ISERPLPVQQRRTDVPDDLARSVMMLLEKDPSNRFPSASALVAALDTGTLPSRVTREAERGADVPIRVSGGNTRGSGHALGPAADTAYPLESEDLYSPTVDERARWEAPL